MHIAITKVTYVKLGRAAQQRVAKAQEENLCVACLEKLDGRVVRGMHERCYRATIRAIKEGRFTAEERMREGKMLESNDGGRPPMNPVSKEAVGREVTR